MTFKQASEYIMPLGKYKGRTLDKIATTDEGLKYLVWLHGVRNSNTMLDSALFFYLSDPTIKKEADKLG